MEKDIKILNFCNERIDKVKDPIFLVKTDLRESELRKIIWNIITRLKAEDDNISAYGIINELDEREDIEFISMRNQMDILI